MILLPSRRLQQPQGLVGIDWSNPLTAGLITGGTVMGGTPYDAVNGVAFVRSAGASLTVRDRGRAAATAAAGDQWLATIPARSMSTRNTGSVMALAYSTVSDAIRKRAIRLANASAGTIFNIDFSDGVSNQTVGGCQVVGGNFPVALDGTVTPVNQATQILYTRDATTQSLYRNGKDVTVGTAGSTTASFAADINQIYLGSNATAFPLQGGVFVWAAWSRALLPDEAKALAGNPWQIFRAPDRRIWISAATGGSHTLTAVDATQSATSSTGTITQAHALAAADASQAGTSTSGAISQVHQLAGAAAAQASTSSTGTISQAHALAGAASSQAATSSTGAISVGVVHNLAGASSTQSATSSTGAVTQVHALAGAPSAQAASSAAAAVSQVHQLAGAACVAGATSSSGALLSQAIQPARVEVRQARARTALASAGARQFAGAARARVTLATAAAHQAA